MSAELWYWSFMGIALVAACGVAIPMMLRTRKLGRAFLWSLVVNALILTGASIWWYDRTTEPAAHTVGRLFFYGIVFVNIEVLLVFALLAMRKNPDTAPEREYPRDGSGPERE